MKKIIHLTDLHLGDSACDKHYDQVLMPKLMARTDDPIIVITGDLVDRGVEPGALDRAWNVTLGDLRGKFDVFVVPGNHDCGSYNKSLKDAFMIRELAEDFREIIYGDRNMIFPIVEVIADTDGGKIAFIGLDSQQELLRESKSVIGAHGRIGREQLSRLQDLLDEDATVAGCAKKVVCLHHDPFNGIPAFHLLDRLELSWVVQGEIDCLLFGHRHVQASHAGAKRWRIPHCYCGGTSTGKPKEPPSGVRVIDLDDDAGVYNWL